MKTLLKVAFRILALACVVWILIYCFSASTPRVQTLIDVKAALLVFVMPLLLLLVFERSNLPWMVLYRRAREALQLDDPALRQDLFQHTDGATGQYSHSYLVKMGAQHSDSFVRYATHLVSSKFSGPELSQLLAQRIALEDDQWLKLSEIFAFLAKMAPYFGMLATVIGMTQLLENMTDFARISGSMALAMQGTLYGLLSFTLLYSPCLKFLSDWREQLHARNSEVAHWFVQITTHTDAAFIRETLGNV